jgi:hypothetical protein
MLIPFTITYVSGPPSCVGARVSQKIKRKKSRDAAVIKRERSLLTLIMGIF